MFDTNSKRNSKPASSRVTGSTSAGRHLKQPMASTISATRDTNYIPGPDIMVMWKAESASATVSSTGNKAMNSEALVSSEDTQSTPDDAIEKKMKQIDQRDRQHRRKKRVALVLVVAVVTAIPLLAIALLTLV